MGASGLRELTSPSRVEHAFCDGEGHSEGITLTVQNSLHSTTMFTPYEEEGTFCARLWHLDIGCDSSKS